MAAAILATGLLLSACSGAAPTDPSSVTPPGGGDAPSARLVIHDALQPAGDTTNVNWSPSHSAGPSHQYQALDDFEIPSPAAIHTVSWQGVYCASSYNPPPVAARTALGFEVAFYADSNGGPVIYPNQEQGVPVPRYIATFTLEDVHETLDVNTNAVCSNSGEPSPTGLYNYTVTLPKPFAVNARTRYWIRIQADTGSFGKIWGWRHGKAGNGIGALTISGNLYRPPHDLAFLLSQ